MADSPFDLRLSHAADWVGCGAYVRMNQTPQAAVIDGEQDHTVREEGTAMHWVAECMLRGTAVTVGDIAPNGVKITDELFDGAIGYVAVLQSYKESTAWRIEEQLAAPSIHPKCGGKPDAFGHDLFRPRVRVPDLKGGFIPVKVFPNWQLLGYLRAILDNNPSWEVPELEVEFIIVQPRAYHRDGPVRKHVMLVRDCVEYFEALRMAAHVAMGDYAKAVAGSQCDNCAARASCSIAHAAGMRALEVAGEPDVHDLPPEAIDYEMQRIEEAQAMLKARLTGLQAQAAYMIRNGACLTHYGLESGVGRLNWIDDDHERAALAMGDLMGYDLRKPAAAITPLQAMKKMPADLLEQYARRPRGEVKLVRVDRDAAVKAFSHLTISKE